MKTILIIDDDEAVLQLFTEYLVEKGYTVLNAADGRAGLRLFETARPDLVITDIMLPEMDGLEIIRNLRKKSPDLPVIAISGGMRNATISFLPQAKTFGACRVIEKPVSLSALLQTVKELLGESDLKPILERGVSPRIQASVLKERGVSAPQIGSLREMKP